MTAPARLGVWGHLKAELKDGFGVLARWWLRGLLATVLLYELLWLFAAPWSSDWPAALIGVLVFAVFGALHGSIAGLFTGGVALGGRLFGASMLIPFVLFPLLVGLSVWAGTGWLEYALTDLGHAVTQAGQTAGHAALSDIGSMPVARAGGPIGALILLFVLAWAIPVFLAYFFTSGAVWLAVLHVSLALVVLVGIGTLVATALSAPPLLIALAWRLRARAKERS